MHRLLSRVVALIKIGGDAYVVSEGISSRESSKNDLLLIFNKYFNYINNNYFLLSFLTRSLPYAQGDALGVRLLS